MIPAKKLAPFGAATPVAVSNPRVPFAQPPVGHRHDMSVWQRISDQVTGRARATPGEPEGTPDEATAGTRATGGVADSGADDPNSTTGTTPNETFVGRASGDEAGEAETSGAEKRAEWEAQGRPAGGPSD
jgi:hypothetical protein